MSVESLKMISWGAYAFSAVFFLITIIVFVKLNIKEIIGELTGVTQRKAINAIRSQSSEEKKAFYDSAYVRGKANVKNPSKIPIKTTGKMVKPSSTKLDADIERESETRTLIPDERVKEIATNAVSPEKPLGRPEKIIVVASIVLCATDEVIS